METTAPEVIVAQAPLEGAGSIEPFGLVRGRTLDLREAFDPFAMRLYRIEVPEGEIRVLRIWADPAWPITVRSTTSPGSRVFQRMDAAPAGAVIRLRFDRTGAWLIGVSVDPVAERQDVPHLVLELARPREAN